MESYKKRSFGFANVAESRELRAKRKSVDRANVKNQRLSVLRQINVENLEQDTVDEKPAPPKVVNEEPKQMSRLEKLKKWKEEKEMKKKIEASKKNPVFKVSKVSSGLNPAFRLPSKNADSRINGYQSFTTKATTLKAPNQRFGSATQANYSRPVTTRSKVANQCSSTVKQMNISHSMATHPKVTNQHSSFTMKQAVARVQPIPVVGKNVSTGVNFRSGIKPLPKASNTNILPSKNAVKNNIPKNAGIPVKCSTQNPSFGSSKRDQVLQKSNVQPKENDNSTSSSEKMSHSRSSFAPADFAFTAPSIVKNLSLRTKGIAAMFAEIFDISFPNASEQPITDTKPKTTMEESITSPKKPSPPPEFDIPKGEKKRISTLRPLQTISENAELSEISTFVANEEANDLEISPIENRKYTRRSRRLISVYDSRASDFNAEQNSKLKDDESTRNAKGTVVEQAACDTPVKHLAKGLHNLKVDSPSAQKKEESEVKRPFTRLQQRISLLGTPEKPQTRARKSIKGDLISFSPIV